MSLSKWERQALGSIEDRLARSDPALASLLVIFSRLALGQEMPVRGKIRALRRRAAHRRRRTGGHRGQDAVLPHAWRLYLRLARQRAALLLWVVISAGLIAVALALTTGGHVTCTQLMRVACGG